MFYLCLINVCLINVFLKKNVILLYIMLHIFKYYTALLFLCFYAIISLGPNYVGKRVFQHALQKINIHLASSPFSLLSYISKMCAIKEQSSR